MWKDAGEGLPTNARQVRAFGKCRQLLKFKIMVFRELAVKGRRGVLGNTRAVG